MSLLSRNAWSLHWTTLSNNLERNAKFDTDRKGQEGKGGGDADKGKGQEPPPLQISGYATEIAYTQWWQQQRRSVAASDDTWRIEIKCAFPGPTATPTRRCCGFNIE